jgi:hypothetical protein
MKWLLFASLLLVSLTGKSQSTSATWPLHKYIKPSHGYIIYSSPLLYVNLADTATRHTIASPLVPPGGKAYVVKRFNSYWYIVSTDPKGALPHYYLHYTDFQESEPIKSSAADSTGH